MQGFELANSDIYPIDELQDSVKRLVLQIKTKTKTTKQKNPRQDLHEAGQQQAIQEESQ